MHNVLIVDDMLTDRTLIGKVVAEAGLQPVYAANGMEALAGARLHHPVLIFLDVVMPDVNGFNVCRDLKKDPATSAIPICLVTTKNTESDRFWGKKQGADDHIGKPFSPEVLLAVLRRYVKR
jgi:twitching motility two-component system response regulator PilH